MIDAPRPVFFQNGDVKVRGLWVGNMLAPTDADPMWTFASADSRQSRAPSREELTANALAAYARIRAFRAAN